MAAGANVSRTGPDQSSVIEATASGSTLTIAFKDQPAARADHGQARQRRDHHRPFLARVPTARRASRGAGNRVVRFSGGDNDTKYHIALPLGFLTDKLGFPFSGGDCRKMYMVFRAPRFEIVEEALGDGCFLTADVGPGATCVERR